MIFFSLVYNELIKIYSKWRTYLGFLALGVLMPLVLWGISTGAGHVYHSVTQQLSQHFILVGSLFNGLLATYIVMNFLWVHIPFLITLVAGDVVAGEGAAGTYRIYLTRPISRVKILWAKLMATYIYTASLIVFFALMSLGLGSLWLGMGDLVVANNGILILSGSVAWARFGLSFLFATGLMCVVASLCFMFSSMVNNGIGPIIGAMSVIIIGLGIATIPIDTFKEISPYLFTHYFDLWRKAFDDPIPWGDIWHSTKILGAYTIAFVAVSFAIFTRKDILT